MRREETGYEQALRAGREIVYAQLALSPASGRREGFEKLALGAPASVADPGDAEFLGASAGRAVAAVLVCEHRLAATTDAARRFGQVAGRGVWNALALSSDRQEVDAGALISAIEGFGRELAAAAPGEITAHDVTGPTSYQREGELLVASYRSAGPVSPSGPPRSLPDHQRGVAGDLICAVVLAVATVEPEPAARAFGRAAARGVRDALSIFAMANNSDRSEHLHTTFEGFAGSLASWMVGGFSSVTPAHE